MAICVLHHIGPPRLMAWHLHLSGPTLVAGRICIASQLQVPRPVWGHQQRGDTQPIVPTNCKVPLFPMCHLVHWAADPYRQVVHLHLWHSGVHITPRLQLAGEVLQPLRHAGV